MIIRSRIAIAILIFACGTASAWAGEGPFRIVQLCLRNANDVALFERVMRAISESKHMEYEDRSAASQRELIALGMSPSYTLINISADRADGVGWGAGNLGLHAYQVAIGFSRGSNPTAAHQFADLVVKRLKQKWLVHVVPPGRGAVQLKNCGT